MTSLTAVRFANLWWNVGAKGILIDDKVPLPAQKSLVHLGTTWDGIDPVTLLIRYTDGGENLSTNPDDFINWRSFYAEDLGRGLLFQQRPRKIRAQGGKWREDNIIRNV